MKITEKSPELIKAQLGEFQANGGLEYEQKKAVATKAGEVLTNGTLGDLVHEYEGKKLQWDDDGKPYYERHLVSTEVPYSSYLDFMRAMPSEDRKRLKHHHEVMLKAFEQYRGDVSTLLAEVNMLEDVKTHPQYLGSGANGSAFWFDHDGKRLVVKRAHGHKKGGYRPIASHGESMPFAIGNDIEGLQHQVAASPDNELVITELLPGKNLKDLSYSEFLGIPDEHVRQVIDLVLRIHQTGLHFDPKVSNLMYDSKKGFSILDYGLEGGSFTPSDPDEFVMELVPSLAPNITSSLRYDSSKGSDNEDNIAARLESQRNGMRLKKRLLRILEEDYPEVIASAAKRQRVIDNDPMKVGGVFADTDHLLIERDPELRRWKEHLIALNLTNAPKEETHDHANDDDDVVDVNLIFD